MTTIAQQANMSDEQLTHLWLQASNALEYSRTRYTEVGAVFDEDAALIALEIEFGDEMPDKASEIIRAYLEAHPPR